MELKYIIDKYGNFAMFTKANTHSEIAKGFYSEPVGAGFCNIRQKADSEDVNVHCYGESVSLNLKSREEDENIINNKLNNPYS